MRKNANPELEKKIIQLRRKGLTIRAIAEQLGNLSPSHIQHYLDKYNFTKQTIYTPNPKKI